MIIPYRNRVWQSKHKLEGKLMRIHGDGLRGQLFLGASLDLEFKVIIFFVSKMV